MAADDRDLLDFENLAIGIGYSFDGFICWTVV
jgi:hypothetical protein